MKIHIFDTTLRDGEQSPGVNLNTEEKLQIAKQLEALNIDVIEAGFPVASPGDFEAVKIIGETIEGPIIAALARAVSNDIHVAGKALKNALRPRIHTFIATSEIHMKYKLKKSEDQVVRMAVEAVKLASEYTSDIEFSAEDAGRSDKDFLCRIFEETIDAGATVINVPDTVGYTVPHEFYDLVKYLKSNIRNVDKAVISVHCHNDLGMAVANSLAAVQAGAQQVEGTINGLGERAGNAGLEEIIMALKTRKDFYNADVDVHTNQIYRTSRLVSSLTGVKVQPNKAIVGANAFAHEAGIHQDGFLKERLTYEIMTPESIGLTKSRLVLGKHSGRHAFRERLIELGYKLEKKDIESAFKRFVELADKKKDITDKDIEVIIDEEISITTELYSLEYLHISTGTGTIPTATISLKRVENEELIEEAAIGDGPIDAIYRAIDRITGLTLKLEEYSIKAVTEGKDALGEVMIRLKYNDSIYTGRGSSTDIMEASTKAYIHAVNKILSNNREKSDLSR